jgi:glutamyl-tRNA reductase
VVDLSVPPAVPANAIDRLGERIVTADALARWVAQGRASGVPIDSRVDRLIERTTCEYVDWLAARQGRATAHDLMDRAERERQAELDELWRRLPALGPDAREAIDAMTRRLARRILREPLERLGRDADGRDGQAVRDVFAL